MRGDLEVSHDTATRWLAWLRELFYVFDVKPWARGLQRSLRKEGKMYMWDWSEVEAPGPRFENLVACHLLKACNFWTDVGEGDFELYLLRDKEKHEIDFVIVRNRRPWLPFEAKLGDVAPAAAWAKLLPQLRVDFGVQLVAEAGHWHWHDVANGRVLVASAEELLGYLV